MRVLPNFLLITTVRAFHASWHSRPTPSSFLSIQELESRQSDFAQRNRHLLVSQDTNESGGTANDGIEEELERLQEQLALIEALEQRNEAQLDSFVDEQDQWDSLESEEKDLLQSKDEILKRMDQITTELLQLWMGAKSQDG